MMWYIIKPIIFVILEIIKIIWILVIYIIFNIFTLIFFFKFSKYENLGVGVQTCLLNSSQNWNPDKSIKETVIRDYKWWFKGKNKIIKILDIDSILKENDICRFVIKTDSGFLTYRPNDFNPYEWHKIKEEMPVWVGKKIKEFPYNHFL